MTRFWLTTTTSLLAIVTASAPSAAAASARSTLSAFVAGAIQEQVDPVSGEILAGVDYDRPIVTANHLMESDTGEAESPAVAATTVASDTAPMAEPSDAALSAPAVEPALVHEVLAEDPEPAPLVPSAEAAMAPDPTPAPTPAPAAPQRPDINPYNRDINMTVPLNFNNRVLGELDVLLTSDDRFIVYTTGFKSLIDPLLTEEAQAEIAEVLHGRESFEAEHIEGSGISLVYDPGQLAVLVLRIDPSKRAVESLFQGGMPEEPGEAPEKYSAYVNANVMVSKVHNYSGMNDPSVSLNGAVRLNKIVLEADYQGQSSFGGEYDVTRRYARAVYDQPDQFRRWWVGDLDPEIRGRQSFVQMGGIGVARQRQRFESFRNSVLSGGRQIVLQENSTVRVMRNGVFMREFKLDAGQYDLSNLPLETGSNDVQLEIVNGSGRVEHVGYSAYLDAIDLDPGDYEYGAYLGVTNAGLFGSPDYSEGDLAFTGYWRKAFLNRPAIGIGIQASENIQNLTGQTQFFLKNGARIRFDGSVSTGEPGQGFAAMVGFDHFVNRGSSYDSWSVAADYVSEDYGTLGSYSGINPVEWSFQAGYSRAFNTRVMASISGSYRLSRSELIGDSYSVNAYSSYKLTDTVSIQAGVDYTKFGQSFGGDREGLGFNVSLSWTPTYNRRLDARYNSLGNAASVRFSQSTENRVGAWGYSLASTYDDGPATLSGQVDYIGNRFDASIMHNAFGQDFSSVSDVQMTSMRVGSALAFVGGKLALSRQIYDSFAFVSPHKSLGDRAAIVGDSFEGGRYQSRSGTFGPAVANNLSAYMNQSVYYDVIDIPAGYDIGEGIRRVRPAYRSGYVIVAGSDAFVSAMGRLVGREDKPASLMSGRVISLDEPGSEPEVFFTNSIGRFAVQKLKPGKRYRVVLYSTPAQSFEFKVPEDNQGLLDLQTVSLPFFVPEQ
ncbi:hypothetical protein [uncultured Brevundimonas sp.]|uniref:hypothetical protein n=1 Tax=uncultured Brevundimonas sp. TaxID=213418 RepID=UPI002612C5CF|nr:hypothetical protein [uncultured Brevundimonas sp.]